METEPHIASNESGPRPVCNRVLVVAPEPFYVDRGTPICVRQVLDALVQIGYQVDLLTYPVGQSIDLPGVTVHRSANPFGFSHVPIGFSFRKLLLDIPLFARLRGLIQSGHYDVVHALEESAFGAVYWGRRAGVRVIYDMHSSMAEQMGALPLFRDSLSRAVFARAERWLLEHASQVVSSSGLAQRVRSVAPRVEVKEWRFSSEIEPVAAGDLAALRKSLSIRPEQRVILYSGTFEPYQGFPLLLSAMPRVLESVPEAIFVLIGIDGESAVARIQRLAHRIPDDRLRLIERQPREAIPAYCAMADVLVSPRMFGGNLPLKIFDYMAAGRPIIATDIPSHRSVLNEERAVLVPPRGDVLGEAIVNLLQNPDEARRLAAAGQTFARQHLAWSTFVRSVDELYCAVAARSERPARGE